jgi:hypothetical protein
MASTRSRNDRIIALYRDAQGRQKSAGTYDTKAEALKAAKHAEALANPPETTMIYPSEKRGKATIAGYGPGLAGRSPARSVIARGLQVAPEPRDQGTRHQDAGGS